MPSEFCKNGCFAEKRFSFSIDELRETGYLDFLKTKGYTPLVFENGDIVFFPKSGLPPGLTETDEIEVNITVRSKIIDEQKDRTPGNS